MRRRDGGGRHDRPFRRVGVSPAEINRCNRTNVQANVQPALDFRAVFCCPAPLPRGCRARTPRRASSPNAPSTSRSTTVPATIVGARSGSQPRHVAALGERDARPGGRAAPRAARGVSRVALDPRRGRRDRARGRSPRTRSRCRPRRPRPGGAARTSAGTCVLDARRARRRPAPRARRRSAGRCAGGARCGGRRRPGSRRGSRPPRARRPRARSSRRRCRSPAARSRVVAARGGRAEERQARLLVAGQRAGPRGRSARAPRRRTAAPLDASRTAEVITAVRDVGAVALDRLRVLVERREHARLRLLRRARRSRRRPRRAA